MDGPAPSLDGEAPNDDEPQALDDAEDDDLAVDAEPSSTTLQWHAPTKRGQSSITQVRFRDE